MLKSMIFVDFGWCYSWSNLENVIFIFKGSQGSTTCLLSKSENTIFILKGLQCSAICLLSKSGKCLFDFKSFIKSQKLYLKHIWKQKLKNCTLSKSETCLFYVQSCATSQTLCLEQIWKMSFWFQSFARFSNMSHDRFWKNSFWILKCRKISKAVSWADFENVILFVEVLQGSTRCLVIVSAKCYFDVQSFAKFNDMSLDCFWKMSFWFSKFRKHSKAVSRANVKMPCSCSKVRKVKQYVSWANLENVILIFKVSHNLKSCLNKMWKTQFQ